MVLLSHERNIPMNYEMTPVEIDFRKYEILDADDIYWSDIYAANIELANKGNPISQLQIGTLYGGGYGVERDHEKAAQWYSKSAAQGLAKAQITLGLYYLRGQGVTRNQTQAMDWFLKAAKQGHSHAQYLLGLMYCLGGGVPKDARKAVKWLKMSAQQEFPPAQCVLGMMYAYGDGVHQNEEKAVSLLQGANRWGLINARFVQSCLLIPWRKVEAGQRQSKGSLARFSRSKSVKRSESVTQ